MYIELTSIEHDPSSVEENYLKIKTWTKKKKCSTSYKVFHRLIDIGEFVDTAVTCIYLDRGYDDQQGGLYYIKHFFFLRSRVMQ